MGLLSWWREQREAQRQRNANEALTELRVESVTGGER